MLKSVSVFCSAAFLILAVALPCPAILYSTFIGGSESDDVQAMVMDGSGNILVVGTTSSSDFPVTSGAYDDLHNGWGDGYVLKLTPDLSTVLASTFLGGSQADYGTGIVLAGNGDLIVCGSTGSSDFPVTPGAYDEVYNGGPADIYLARLSGSLGTLIAATFIGGSGEDEGAGLALGQTGNVLVTGDTNSETDFPVTPGAYDTSFNSSNDYYVDTFVASLSGSLETLEAATYLGGEYHDHGRAVGAWLDGQVTVAGSTSSTDFPITLGTYDPSHNLSSDIFVAHLAADLSELQAATFVGAISFDQAYDMAFDHASQEIVVSGNTTGGNFPVTPGAFDTSIGGENDGVVFKLSADLTTLNRSTFIGGSGYEFLRAVAVGADGTITVVGHASWESAGDFPVTPWAYDTTMDADSSVIVLQFDADLGDLLYATYVGGEAQESATDLLVVDSGRVYVAGLTRSANFPVTEGAFDTTYNGTSAYDGFVLDLRLFENVIAHYECDPVSGTLPFSSAMTVIIENQFDGLLRRLSAHIDLTLGNGSYFPNWRAGFTNVAGGSGYASSWNQSLPGVGSLIGSNVFRIIAEDVTPAPYNQPPYPPAGHSASASCTVVATAP